MLIIIVRLRQMCCHPALVHKILDRHDIEVEEIEGETTGVESQKFLLKDAENPDEDIEFNYNMDNRIKTNLLTKENPVFDDDRRGSKMRAILRKVDEIVSRGEKVVIVSQWTSFLNVISRFLGYNDKVDWRRFTGEVPIGLRHVNKFFYFLIRKN